MSLDSVTIIIRSVGERTESLCKKLILDQGVSEEAIFVIKEAPFSKALKVGLEVGLSEARPWTCCVDADLLLRRGSIHKMLERAESQPSNVCEIQGFILDKFFGGARTGGIHLYRTSLLVKVINSIPPEGSDIRPETYALNAMQRAGYPWGTVRELVGLHDFEQSYDDIFRKCFVQAHKHFRHVGLFVPFWRANSTNDFDYRVALTGFAEGIKHVGEVRINRYAQCFANGLQNFDLAPKHEILLKDWDLGDIEACIKTWVEPPEYWLEYPGGMYASGGGIISRGLAQYESHRASRSIRDSISLTLAWLLAGAGKKLSKHVG